MKLVSQTSERVKELNIKSAEPLEGQLCKEGNSKVTLNMKSARWDTRTRDSMRWNVHSSGKLSTNATQCVCGKNFQVRGETQLKNFRNFSANYIKIPILTVLWHLKPELLNKKLFLEKKFLFLFCRIWRRVHWNRPQGYPESGSRDWNKIYAVW